MAIAAILTVLGAAAQIYGQQEAAEAGKDAADYNAQVALNNQAIADVLAADAIDRGEESVDKHRRGVNILKGSQRAALAKNGVVIDQDTALDLILDTTQLGEMGVQEIRNNAMRDAYGFYAQGAGFGATADLLEAQGAAGQRGADIASATTILGTASTLVAQD